MSGSTEPRCATHSTAAIPASTPAMAKASATTWLALMPTSRTTGKSSAAARMANAQRRARQDERQGDDGQNDHRNRDD